MLRVGTINAQARYKQVAQADVKFLRRSEVSQAEHRPMLKHQRRLLTSHEAAIKIMFPEYELKDLKQGLVASRVIGKAPWSSTGLITRVAARAKHTTLRSEGIALHLLV